MADDALKQLYNETSIQKNLKLTFSGGVSIANTQLYQESMLLKESICDSTSIEFVGCIPKRFEVKTANITSVVKGLEVKVVQEIEGHTVPLFTGFVDSAKMESNKKSKKLICFDALYTKGNVDVSTWYKGLSFPITQKKLRDSLFSHVSIVQEDTILPNDDMVIEKKYNPSKLSALNVMKAICQINGACGIMNRDNKFEYRFLKAASSAIPYPSVSLFPNPYLFPGLMESVNEAEQISYYQKVEYEEYTIKPVDKITIRESADVQGVSCGIGGNNYIIQGNILSYGKTEAELYDIAQNIYQKVSGISFTPVRADAKGLPYIECGDTVEFYTIDGIISSYVMSRQLKGIQALTDTFISEGEEYQTEIVTDLSINIDLIKQDIKETVDNSINDYDFSDKFGDYTYGKGEIDGMFDGFQGGTNIVSVKVLPENPDPDTIYLIQGKVVII